MTNWEKFNESIKDMDFAVQDGKVVPCAGGCNTCELIDREVS